MDQGSYYKTGFKSGECAYLLVGEPLKNGAHRAIAIDDFTRKAKHTTTNYLTASHWSQIPEGAIPPGYLAKIKAKLA